MSFTPVVPSGGYGGWSFLNRTMAAQKKAFAADLALQRDEAHFRDRIGGVSTADDLVADRRLLSVALSAFGLEGDINNKAFLKKILSDGTFDPAALGNRLADKRYLEFSRAFGFGDFAVPNTKKSDFPDKILSAYEARKFEAAVGAANGDMRLALNARRELAAIAVKTLSPDGKWFTALGSPPLRSVLQTAFGLPRSFAGVDIDKQLTVLKERAEKLLGSPDISQFADPGKAEKLIRLFLVRSQAQFSPVAGDGTALSLLGRNSPNTGISAALLSRYV